MGLVLTDTSCYENIANLIRERAGTEIGYTPAEMPDAIRTAWDEAIFNIVFQDGKRTNAEYVCNRWKCEYIRPPYMVTVTSRPINAFSYNSLLKKIEKKYFDFSGYTSSSDTASTNGNYQVFYYCSSLEVMEDIGLPAGYYYQTWGGCSKLHTIELVRSRKTTLYFTPWNYCYELVNIRFEGEIGQDITFASCSKLSNDSINDIIDHLADLTGETAHTITWHSTVTENLTEEQCQRITNKNWKIA